MIAEPLVWLHRRVNEVLFCRLVYSFLVLTGLKLLYDSRVLWQ